LRAEGVAAVAHSAVISYRKDVFKEANEYPKSIKDLWNTEHFPGKRGLVYGARNNLEWALMADGVTKNDVYKVLATAKGVKRALAKLNELKPHIIWFDSEHEVMEALQRHHVGTTDANPDAPAVVFGAVSSDLAYMEERNLERHDHKGFMLDVIWDGQMIEFIYWAKPNNPKDSEAANKFIEVAASEETCLAAINRSALGVTRSDLMKNRKIQQYVLQKMPTFKQNMDKGIIVDGKFWAANMDNLMVKFKKWFKNSGCSRAKVAY
jgi:putative spermidine/putrescine transport system substrate-binding protein